MVPLRCPLVCAQKFSHIKPDRNGRTTGPLVAHRASLRRAAAGQLSGVDRTKPRALQPRRMTLPGTPALSAFAPLPGTSRHQTRRPCGNEQSLPGACRADSADTRGVASTGRLPGAGTDDPSSHALPAADSHPLYEEDVDVDVGVAQLFQRGIVGVVVPCFSLLESRKLQHD